MCSHPEKALSRFSIVLTLLFISVTIAMPAAAIDLVPDIFKDTKINRSIWKLQEQHVALAPQSGKKSASLAKNQHPVILDVGDVRDSLLSLELWIEGGFFRNEDAVPVLSPTQVSTLERYLVEALAEAKPDEDVVFVARGYGNVAMDIVREKYWTAGRVFFSNNKLNVIIGSFQVKKDRGTRQAEGAYGILDNYADLRFDYGSRTSGAKMPGRIVTTAGISLNDAAGRERPDWVQIDLPLAVAGYRDAQIPDEQKKRDAKVKAEAAKLTVERRQMREEMARMRKELLEIKAGGGSAKSLEQRLATLQELKEKNLITDDEFMSRRKTILEEI